MSTSDLNPRDLKGLAFIRTSILYGDRAPTLQAIADHLGYRSRRASALLIERLVAKGYVERAISGKLRLLRGIEDETANDRTVLVPLVGAAPCGAPLLATENTEAMIPVSQRIVRPGNRYFFLRAVGDSMNAAGIQDGDLALVRQQSTAEEGERVVALIDDEATIKEFRKRDNKVFLMPRSSNSQHQPIVLDCDFLIQGVVVDSVRLPE